MKRIALTVLLSLILPLARPALAEPPPRPAHSPRHRRAALSVGLIASLLMVPWSALALGHSARKAKPAKRAVPAQAEGAEVTRAVAVNGTPGGTVNPAPGAAVNAGPPAAAAASSTGAQVKPTPAIPAR